MSRLFKIAHEMAKDIYDADGMDDITMRNIDALCLPPKKQYSAFDIKKIREGTRMSQAVFAACLNVGLSTIQQWEMGLKKPSAPAAKLLDVVKRKGIEVLC